jgi:large subunit ribosomal protein L6
MYSVVMTNLFRESIYIPSIIEVECKGWKLHLKKNTQNICVSFPIHTLLVYEENYLKVDIVRIDSIFYGGFLRKLKSLIQGLVSPYKIRLQFVGRGYIATKKENIITLKLGYSHSITVKIPDTVKVTLIKANQLKLLSYNYEYLTQFAYKVRSFREPEPFKGKGIVCVGEKVRRKEGKKKLL